MKDAYYFGHDANAHNDPKMLNLRLGSGWEGIGLYWTFLEILRDMPNYKYDEENHLASLSLRLNTPQATLQAWLNQCYKVGLFECKNGHIYSQPFLSRMEEIDEKRHLLSEAGKRGGIASSQAKARLKAGSSSKGKERKGKEMETMFERFYSKYPKKQGKTQAYKAFEKLSPTNELLLEILRGVETLSETENWKKSDGQFIPMPATFLNGRRWEDEVSVKKDSYVPNQKF